MIYVWTMSSSLTPSFHPGIFIDNSLQQGAVMGMEVVVCRLHAEVVAVVVAGIEVRSLILEVGVLDTLH